MQTLRQALDLGLINKVAMSAKGLTIYSTKRPDGAMYSWDFYEKNLQPKLASKCQQAEEANAGTLEPQA
jgi:hypothetical protein